MEETAIPWSRTAAFVRQLTHDVRNGLNSLDLETEFLHELVSADTEATSSVDRVRKQLRGVAQQLRTLSALFQDPSPVVAKIPARVLLKIWREKHAALVQPPIVQWDDRLGDEEVSADVEMMATVFRELLANAAMYSADVQLCISACGNGKQVVFELREPKKVPVDSRTWAQPFSSTRREHYGLGLWNARRLMDASGVTFSQRYSADDACLITRLALPVV